MRGVGERPRPEKEGTGSRGSNAWAHHASLCPPSPRAAWPPPPISLTTLSSGTERLRVHSWLFTKESAGEKATHQDSGGTQAGAIATSCLLYCPFLGHGQKTAPSQWDPNPHS